MPENILLRSDLENLKLLKRGKVRDVYEFDDKLLIVASDRMSAFDVVMDDPIPDKGKILTSLSVFWFNSIQSIVENHLISTDVSEYPEPCLKYKSLLEGRSMLVKKAEPLVIECIVRGYISGSGWVEYQSKGSICGVPLPERLVESEKLQCPIFTPSTKAMEGAHDENISFDHAVEILGKERAEEVQDLSLRIYEFGRAFAAERGIIIADTKFEFGFKNGRFILIDEVLSPDSSRFWPVESYKVGQGQPSFDKQPIRDYLDGQDWDKKAPGPVLPDEVIDASARRYRRAQELLTGKG